MSQVLQGQVALVTGASRGIGRAIALELGRLGATVVGTATSDKGAADIQAGLVQFELQAEPIAHRCDGDQVGLIDGRGRLQRGQGGAHQIGSRLLALG